MLDLGADVGDRGRLELDRVLRPVPLRVVPFFLQDAAWSVDDQQVFVATTGYKPITAAPTGARSGLCDAAAAFPASPTTVSHELGQLHRLRLAVRRGRATARRSTSVGTSGSPTTRWVADGAGPGAVAAPGYGRPLDGHRLVAPGTLAALAARGPTTSSSPPPASGSAVTTTRPRARCGGTAGLAGIVLPAVLTAH